MLQILNRIKMKRIILLTLAISSIGLTKAQNSKAVFETHEIVWYGLDFTKAKFVGQFDQGMGAMPATGHDMRTKWIPQWNALIAKEKTNFPLNNAFDVDNIAYDMGPVNTINSKIDASACMVFNPGTIDRKEIDGMVAKYTAGEKKDGIACVFIVENFDKGAENASVYVTFFDIASKKVLLCQKEEGKPLGVGMRNYWAGSVKSIIKQIQKDWRSWKG